jgi:CPA1 family monovalent cation:H+ antiporter
VGLTLADVHSRIAALSQREPIERPVADRLIAEVKERQRKPGEAMAELGDEDLLRFGLGTLVSQEAELCRRRLGDGTANRETVEALIADVTRLADGLKTGGRPGYEAAAELNLGFAWSFRLANWLYHRLGWEVWLAGALAERFQRLFVSGLVLTDLAGFAERKLASMAGPGASRTLARIIEERREATDRALAAFRLQYPDYSRALQEIYVGRLTLRLIEDGYNAMLAESVLSQELHDDLMRGLEDARRRFDRLPRLDIAMPREALVRRVKLFQGITPEIERRIAQLLRPRLAFPGEKIVVAGGHGDAMFFIASGAVEVQLKTEPVRLGSGEFFGEIALIEGRPRTADVVALGFTQLLALYARDLDRLIASDPEIGRQLRIVARERLEAQRRSAS